VFRWQCKHIIINYHVIYVAVNIETSIFIEQQYANWGLKVGMRTVVIIL